MLRILEEFINCMRLVCYGYCLYGRVLYVHYIIITIFVRAKKKKYRNSFTHT